MCVHKWAEIISKHVTKLHTYLDPKFIIYLKDNICPCDQETARVNYIKLTNPFDSNSSLLDFLKNAFSLIDVDNNGSISHEEACRAIKIVNKSMGTNYDSSYISNMDTDGNGVVDFEEFSKGFSNAMHHLKN